MRAFLAINLNQTINQKICDYLNKLRPEVSDKVRITPSDNLHLTLQFLGNISQQQLQLVCVFLKDKLNNFSDFKITCAKLGPFPSEYKPHILALHFEANETLDEIAQICEQTTEIAKIKTKKHTFKAHLTLARINHGKFPEIKNTALFTGMTSIVSEVILYDSVSVEGGVKYELLENFKLQ